jgi:hypothetical protein
MTDDEALSECETALGLSLLAIPDLLGRPRKEHGSGWCAHILDREVRAWHELHSRKLLNGRCAIGKVILMQRR